MSDFATLPLILIFAAAAVPIWVAGIRLAGSTDALDHKLGSDRRSATP